MTPEMIEQIALANSFKLKSQPDGSMALNPYVFEFAKALLASIQPEGWPTEEMLLAGFHRYQEVMNGFEPTGLDAMEAAFKAMFAAATTPPAPDDEPALWYEAEEKARGVDIRHVIGSMIYSTRIHTVKPETGNPVWSLYTRPNQSPAKDAVKLPTNADEAEMMVKLGSMWLEQNAPERLKAQ